MYERDGWYLGSDGGADAESAKVMGREEERVDWEAERLAGERDERW